MGCVGGAGVQGGRGIGEDHTSCEGGERGCRCEDGGVECLHVMSKEG